VGDLVDDPAGHRVHVIDYDATPRTMYRPAQVIGDEPLLPADDAQILDDPAFTSSSVTS
jgi:hypothetical protein